jgi:asparagine synthetase B (glutamine-hydrolysing)
MSGFVGIVNGSGAPVDSRLLRRLTEFMSYRGPDAREIWVDEAVGFGRARLRTKQDSATDRLSCSLDNRLWTVGDVRLDARSDLLDRLHRRWLEPESDLKLLLRAYDGGVTPASTICWAISRSSSGIVHVRASWGRETISGSSSFITPASATR